MLGDLFKSQKFQKYPFRKSKGLFSLGFILVMNLLVDVLVKKSVALCQCIIRKSQNEQTLPNRYFIEVSRWVPLTNLTCSRTLVHRFTRLLVVPAFRPPRETDENGSQPEFRKSKHLKHLRLQNYFQSEVCCRAEIAAADLHFDLRYVQPQNAGYNIIAQYSKIFIVIPRVNKVYTLTVKTYQVSICIQVPMRKKKILSYTH